MLSVLIQTTSKDMVVLNDLLPYTTYTVRVRVTNYYRPLEHSLPIGDAVMFSTKAGGKKDESKRYV